MKNLVGQTVVSPQDKKNGGNATRHVHVLREFLNAEKKRIYDAYDETNKKQIEVCADTYDRLFLVKKTAIKGKYTKGNSIHSPSSPDYKLKK